MNKVTASITSYNQESFIAQTVGSALMQRTSFDYEILIGEDESSGRTREIVTSLQRRHGSRIRVLLNSRTSVIRIRGKPTGRWNLMNNIREARGEYIALMGVAPYVS